MNSYNKSKVIPLENDMSKDVAREVYVSPTVLYSLSLVGKITIACHLVACCCSSLRYFLCMDRHRPNYRKHTIMRADYPIGIYTYHETYNVNKDTAREVSLE